MSRRMCLALGVALMALSLVTSGVIINVYVLGRVQAPAAAMQAVADLERDWASTFATTAADVATVSSSPSRASSPATRAVAAPLVRLSPLKVGDVFGKIYIPRLRDRAWGLPMVEGIEPKHIDAGFAHFPMTALPGEIGNFALAAHRATHLEPLAEVDRLRKGDKVLVQTKFEWLVYTLTRDRIVTPQDTWVVDPVPGSSSGPAGSLITLVTCEPRWGSGKRWIWWGELTSRHSSAISVASVMQRAR